MQVPVTGNPMQSLLLDACPAACRRRARARMVARGWAACSAFLLLGACYRYTPTPDAPVAAGDVRLHLSDAGAKSVAPVIGEGMTSVSGRVISASESDLVLIVSETAGPDRRVSWAGERITLPRSSLASVERRTLDRWRTAGVGALGVGAAGAVALIINAMGSRGDGDGNGGPIITPPDP